MTRADAGGEPPVARPRAQPRPWRPDRGRLVWLVLRGISAGWIVSWWVWLIGYRHTFVETDSQAYWGFDLGTLYSGVNLGDQGAFLYSPPVALLFALTSLLPYGVFYAMLAAVNLAALVYLLGLPLAALSLFVLPVSNEVARGNIHLLLAFAIVVGFRYPGAWAWVMLTKVTPAIGLLWFALRREWPALAWALGMTAVLVAVTYAAMPGLWNSWFDLLVTNVEATRPNAVFEVPVLPRLAIAGLLVYVAARRDRPALVPAACLLALPAIWVNSLALLVAVVPLWRDRQRWLGHRRAAAT